MSAAEIPIMAVSLTGCNRRGEIAGMLLEALQKFARCRSPLPILCVRLYCLVFWPCRASFRSEEALARSSHMKQALPKAILFFIVALAAWYVRDVKVYAQAGNGIAEPADGETVSGIVVVQGTADHPRFLRYELAFLQESRPGTDWIVFAQGDQPVLSDTLAVWDTTVGLPASPVFPDGQYRLRLRVVREDYNYDEFFVSQLTVSNLTATPSPTATLTTTTRLTPTLPSAEELEATRRASTGTLPTLTPFPTPSPPPTPAGGALGAADADGDEDEDAPGGLFARFAAIETSRFGRAFWFGVTAVLYVFAALALYVLLRGAWRWLRRTMRARSNQ